MSSQDNDGEQGLTLIVVFGLIAFAVGLVGLVLGIGIYQSHQMRQSRQTSAFAGVMPVEATAVVGSRAEIMMTPVDTASLAQAASDAASVKVENNLVEFYFKSGQAELASGAGDALTDIIKNAAGSHKLVISGFHDATGNAANNAVLARQRAMAVRAALKAAGVNEHQIELKHPEQIVTSSNNAQARRVEVSLQ